MASLVTTQPTLRTEIEEEFGDLQLELVHCESCGDYHPPELHLARTAAWEDDAPAEG